MTEHDDKSDPTNWSELATQSEQHTRIEPRIYLSIDGSTLRVSGGSKQRIALNDLSAHGFSTEWPNKVRKGDRVWLKIPNLEALSAEVVWEHQFKIGCKFEAPLHASVLDRIVKVNQGN